MEKIIGNFYKQSNWKIGRLDHPAYLYYGNILGGFITKTKDRINASTFVYRRISVDYLLR